MRKVLILSAVVMFPLFGHAEDMSNRFAACGVMENDQQRLACYDKIRDDAVAQYQSQSVQPSSEYKAMELIDLKTDIKSLSGSKIAVVGLLQVLGDMLLLKSELMDMTPVTLNGSGLNREDRKKILQDCSQMCMVKVEGVVADGALGEEVKVKNIYFE